MKKNSLPASAEANKSGSDHGKREIGARERLVCDFFSLSEKKREQGSRTPKKD
jgi:hypothetical protein